jgi:hypothetical protein
MSNYTGTRGYVVGATPTTTGFLDLGTITLSTDATAILGFWAAGGQAAETTNESVITKIRFTVGNVVYGPFPCNPTQGEGAATNEGAVAWAPDWWSLLVPKNATSGGIGGLQIIPAAIADQRGTPTNGNSMVGGCLTWEGPLPQPGILDEIRESARLGAQMGFINGAPAGGNAATGATAVTANATAQANITVLPDANVITGFSTAYSLDAVGAAGVETVGWIDYTSSISGFGTQQYPFSGRSATLGTPVGMLMAPPITHLPAWIPTSTGARANWTITPTVRLNVTIDSTNFLSAAYWR